MPCSMYQAYIPPVVSVLGGLLTVLDKAAAHAAAKKIDQTVLLNLRVYPDMFPLVQQVQQATDHARRPAAMLTGTPLLDIAKDETSIDALKARVQKSIDYLKGFKPEQIDGTENREFTIKLGPNDRAFKGQPFLINFSLPNFYFHATTAYNILRGLGVEVGKRDFMGPPPG
jgi:uncharacterized protein